MKQSNLEQFAQKFNPGKDSIYGLGHVRDAVTVKIDGRGHDLIVDDISARIDLDQFLGDSGDTKKWKPIDHEFMAFIRNHDKKRTSNSIAAACKLFIQFCGNRGGKIHFFLEDIDVKNLAKKHNYSLEEDDMEQPKNTAKIPNVTGSELRAIYRMWHADPASTKHVLFYNSMYQEVEAPWQSNPNDWESYRQSLDAKIKLPQQYPDNLLLRQHHFQHINWAGEVPR